MGSPEWVKPFLQMTFEGAAVGNQWLTSLLYLQCISRVQPCQRGYVFSSVTHINSIHPSTNDSCKNACYHPGPDVCQLPPSFICESRPSISVQASHSLSFPSLNESLPTVTCFPLFFITQNGGRTRILTEPWNFPLATQFVPRIQTDSQTRTFNRCKL